MDKRREEGEGRKRGREKQKGRKEGRRKERKIGTAKKNKCYRKMKVCHTL